MRGLEDIIRQNREVAALGARLVIWSCLCHLSALSSKRFIRLMNIKTRGVSSEAATPSSKIQARNHAVHRQA